VHMNTLNRHTTSTAVNPGDLLMCFQYKLAHERPHMNTALKTTPQSEGFATCMQMTSGINMADKGINSVSATNCNRATLALLKSRRTLLSVDVQAPQCETGDWSDLISACSDAVNSPQSSQTDAARKQKLNDMQQRTMRVAKYSCCVTSKKNDRDIPPPTINAGLEARRCFQHW